MIVCRTQRTEINTRISTPAVYDVITLAMFKQHLKWDADDTTEDALMTQYLQSAIREAEMYTRRTLGITTYKSYLTGFSFVILDVLPVDATTIVVKYFDVSNAEQTLSSTEYVITDYGPDEYVTVDFTGTLPTLYSKNQNVYIQFNAGYTSYPTGMVSLILRRAADYFEVRTNQVNGSLTTVEYNFHMGLFPYKVLC